MSQLGTAVVAIVAAPQRAAAGPPSGYRCVYEVLGTSGDTFLGGDDFDERLVESTRLASACVAAGQLYAAAGRADESRRAYERGCRGGNRTACERAGTAAPSSAPSRTR